MPHGMSVRRSRRVAGSFIGFIGWKRADGMPHRGAAMGVDSDGEGFSRDRGDAVSPATLPAVAGDPPSRARTLTASPTSAG